MHVTPISLIRFFRDLTFSPKILASCCSLNDAWKDLQFTVNSRTLDIKFEHWNLNVTLDVRLSTTNKSRMTSQWFMQSIIDNNNNKPTLIARFTQLCFAWSVCKVKGKRPVTKVSGFKIQYHYNDHCVVLKGVQNSTTAFDYHGRKCILSGISVVLDYLIAVW